jgi:hypothetical protein
LRKDQGKKKEKANCGVVVPWNYSWQGRNGSKAGCPVVVFDKQSCQKEENYALDAHFHQRKGTSAAAQPKSLWKAQDMTKTGGPGNRLLDPRRGICRIRTKLGTKPPYPRFF